MLKLRPDLIALDPGFVATSGGAMLIALIKADRELATVDLRVLMTVERVTFGPQRRFDIPIEPRVQEATGPAIAEAIRSVSDPLAWRGIRRAERFALNPDAPAAVNGEATQLVNLSATGVQLVSPSRLRPAETFRLTLQHPEREARLHAVVAWCSLQGSGSAPTYRAGASFVESDRAVIEAYCQRYGRSIQAIGNATGLSSLTEFALSGR